MYFNTPKVTTPMMMMMMREKNKKINYELHKIFRLMRKPGMEVQMLLKHAQQRVFSIIYIECLASAVIQLME